MFIHKKIKFLHFPYVRYAISACNHMKRQSFHFVVFLVAVCTLFTVFYNHVRLSGRKQLVSTTKFDFIVTGGAGFIGHHLVFYIFQQRPYARVLVLDDLSRGRRENVDARAKFVKVDLRNYDECLKHIQNADTVFHLADVVAGIDYIFSHQAEVFRTNILINTNVIHACRTNKVKNYVYVGTACSYPLHLQSTYDTAALRENQTYPAEPESSYGWSKLMGEYEATLVRAETPEMNVGINRLHNVYGPGMVYGPIGSQIIPSLIRKALSCPHREEFAVWGSGNQYRDFIHVQDVVRGIWDTRFGGGMNQGTIQLSTGVPESIATTAKLILDISKHVLGKQPCNMVLQQHMMEGDKGRVGIADRARDLIQWRPRIDFKEGVVNTFVDVMGRMAKNGELSPEIAAAVSEWKGTTVELINLIIKRTLVIVAGQARGGPVAWKSLEQNLLIPLQADLATCFGDAQPIPPMLQKMAKYQWTVPEVSDWADMFDIIAEQSCPQSDVGKDWRKWLCPVPGIMLGGINGCGDGGAGSGGILLAFRWAVHRKLTELSLWDRYEYFVFTRADHVYLCEHPAPWTLENGKADNAIFIPEGQDYLGGVTDRHVVARSHNFNKAIDIGSDFICKGQTYNSIFMPMSTPVNLEMMLTSFFKEQVLEVFRYNRVMFTVRQPNDPTRWSKGENSDLISDNWGFKLKYPPELRQSIATCKTDVDTALTKFK
jgi:nucleoside-diphosphate-sugar epimerase